MRILLLLLLLTITACSTINIQIKPSPYSSILEKEVIKLYSFIGKPIPKNIKIKLINEIKYKSYYNIKNKTIYLGTSDFDSMTITVFIHELMHDFLIKGNYNKINKSPLLRESIPNIIAKTIHPPIFNNKCEKIYNNKSTIFSYEQESLRSLETTVLTKQCCNNQDNIFCNWVRQKEVVTAESAYSLGVPFEKFILSMTNDEIQQFTTHILDKTETINLLLHKYDSTQNWTKFGMEHFHFQP